MAVEPTMPEPLFDPAHQAQNIDPFGSAPSVQEPDMPKPADFYLLAPPAPDFYTSYRSRYLARNFQEGLTPGNQQDLEFYHRHVPRLKESPWPDSFKLAVVTSLCPKTWSADGPTLSRREDADCLNETLEMLQKREWPPDWQMRFLGTFTQLPNGGYYRLGVFNHLLKTLSALPWGPAKEMAWIEALIGGQTQARPVHLPLLSEAASNLPSAWNALLSQGFRDTDEAYAFLLKISSKSPGCGSLYKHLELLCGAMKPMPLAESQKQSMLLLCAESPQADRNGFYPEIAAVLEEMHKTNPEASITIADAQYALLCKLIPKPVPRGGMSPLHQVAQCIQSSKTFPAWPQEQLLALLLRLADCPETNPNQTQCDTGRAYNMAPWLLGGLDASDWPLKQQGDFIFSLFRETGTESWFRNWDGWKLRHHTSYLVQAFRKAGIPPARQAALVVQELPWLYDEIGDESEELEVLYAVYRFGVKDRPLIEIRRDLVLLLQAIRTHLPERFRHEKAERQAAVAAACASVLKALGMNGWPENEKKKFLEVILKRWNEIICSNGETGPMEAWCRDIVSTVEETSKTRWSLEDRIRVLNLISGGAPANFENRSQIMGRFTNRSFRADGFFNLQGLSIENKDLSGLDLSFADLSASDLRGSKLAGARLEGAILSGAWLDAGQIQELRDQGALKGANGSTDLSGMKLDHADLSRIPDLSVFYFRGASVRYVKLGINSLVPFVRAFSDSNPGMEGHSFLDGIRVPTLTLVFLNHPQT